MSANRMTSYLVCHDKVSAVRDFLSQFLVEERGDYNHSEWITFKIPNSEFLLNLMAGNQQPLTQNFTLEIQCESLQALRKLASEKGKKLNSFAVTKTAKPYTFHYISLAGPADICKVEANFSELS